MPERASTRKRRCVNYGEQNTGIEYNEVIVEKKKPAKQIKAKASNKTSEKPKENKGSAEAIKSDKTVIKLKEMSGRIVMSVPSLLRARVVNRPSKVVKSPYMADIILEGLVNIIISET